MLGSGPVRFEGWALPPTVPFLNWAWDDIMFLILAGILLGAAVFVVIGRDIVRSGLAMILSFAALAGIYVLAGATIVAAAQVLIYIGAISVLILFAIMLTQTKSGPAQLVFHHQAWAGAVAALAFAVLMVASLLNTEWPLVVTERLHADTREVAMLLFTDPLYVFSLQLIAVLLTAAVVGAVFLAKREDVPDPGEVATTQPLLVRPATTMASGPAESTASQAASDSRVGA